MNEILVEEENTVYELDPECLRHKEEQRQLEEKRKQEKQENDNYRMQKRPEKRNQNNMWIICLLLLVICQYKRGCRIKRHPLLSEIIKFSIHIRSHCCCHIQSCRYHSSRGLR